MKLRLMLAAALGFVLVGAGPAQATFTENDIGCAGSADIVDGDKTYRVDAADSTAKVPRQGTAHYEGTLDTVTHDHSGEVNINILGFKVNAGSWGPSKNALSLPEKKGEKEIPSIMNIAPPGKYVVDGFHKGNEGGCAGNITVDVQGSPLSSPFAIASILGTLVSGLAMALGAVTKAA